MSQLLEGRSGTAYLNATDGHDEAIKRLRRGYLEIAIASMLDIAEINAREGLRPEVVALLLEASRRL